jgi:hypothetical protein
LNSSILAMRLRISGVIWMVSGLSTHQYYTHLHPFRRNTHQYAHLHPTWRNWDPAGHDRLRADVALP